MEEKKRRSLSNGIQLLDANQCVNLGERKSSIQVACKKICRTSYFFAGTATHRRQNRASDRIHGRTNFATFSESPADFFLCIRSEKIHRDSHRAAGTARSSSAILGVPYRKMIISGFKKKAAEPAKEEGGNPLNDFHGGTRDSLVSQNHNRFSPPSCCFTKE